MNSNLMRAQVLLEQDNYVLAEEKFRLALAEDPESGAALGGLAVALALQSKIEEALQVADSAIATDPDDDYLHYVRALTLLNNAQLKEARKSISVAIEMDPENPDYRGILASVALREARFAEALAEAVEGLRVDPSHNFCGSIRSQALLKLGRKTEAVDNLRTQLAQHPNSSHTHATAGWNFLEQGRRNEAMHHFNEALRLDPDNETARIGLLQAIKAGNLVFRLLLTYGFWMSRLSEGKRWVMIIGAFLLFKFSQGLLKTDPDMAPIANGALILYLGFVALTWTGNAFFDLTLFFHPKGRHALKPEEKGFALALLTAFGAALACGLASVLVSAEVLFSASVGFFLLALPIGAAANTDHRRRQTKVIIFTGVAGLTLVLGTVLDLLGVSGGSGLVTAAILSLALFTWFGNFLVEK